MMNECGVPMNDAEMSMLPPGANKPHERMLAESGMEHNLFPVIAGAALGGLVGSSVVIGTAATALTVGAGVAAGAGLGYMQHRGSQQAADAAGDAADAQNQATERRYQYDTQMWDMKKKQLQSERQEAVDRIFADARNEGKLRAYKDAANETQHQYALQIRNAQQASNEAQFLRSDSIYRGTTDLNYLSSKAAMDSEIVKLEEAADVAAFDKNNAWLEAIEAEGKLRARGVSGRSARKGRQSTMADFGKEIEMLNATMVSTGRNTRAVLEEIIRDKTSADLVAYASKMLDPGVLPDPIKAESIPIPEYTLPRALSEYDYGPAPVYGAMADAGAARRAVQGQATMSMASSIMGLGTAVLGKI